MTVADPIVLVIAQILDRIEFASRPSSNVHEITSSFNGKPKATEFRAMSSCTLSPLACR